MACGEIGLTITYFYSLTPREFDNILTGYRNKEEAHFKNQWEQTRQLMYAALQPHAKKGKSLDIKFPWEKETLPTRTAQRSREEMKKLFEKIDKNLNKPNE